MTAVKRYKTKWNDRWKFFQDLVGRTYTTSDGSIVRRFPYAHPDAPWLYAQALSCAPLGAPQKNTTPAAWEFAVVDVTFSTVSWAFDAGQQQGDVGGIFRSESIELSGEMLQLPASGFTFQSNPAQRVTHNVGRVTPIANISVAQDMCPYIPYDLVFQHIGNVHSVPFYGADPGKVMFQGCQTESQFGVGDILSAKLMNQRITTKFAYRPISWNQYMMPDGSGFDTLLDANGDPVYSSSDLNEIFF